MYSGTNCQNMFVYNTNLQDLKKPSNIKKITQALTGVLINCVLNLYTKGVYSNAMTNYSDFLVYFLTYTVDCRKYSDR